MPGRSKVDLLALSGTFTGLCTLTVGLRFYVRKRQDLRLLADDWIALVALATLVGGAICVFLSVHDKFIGYSDSDETDPESAASYQSADSHKVQIAQVVLNTSTLAFVKLSALFFYRRVFCVSKLTHWFDIATFITIIVVVLWLIVFDFLGGFQCAISDFLLDLWILALPIPRILELHASLSRKLSIIGVFLLALIGFGASIARMVQYIELGVENQQYFVHHHEERSVIKAVCFPTLEAGMSLIAVNLPSLWPLATAVDPKNLLRRVRNLISPARSRSSSKSVSSTPV